MHAPTRIPPQRGLGSVDAAPALKEQARASAVHTTAFTFITLQGIRPQTLARMLHSLVRVSRRVGCDRPWTQRLQRRALSASRRGSESVTKHCRAVHRPPRHSARSDPASSRKRRARAAARIVALTSVALTRACRGCKFRLGLLLEKEAQGGYLPRGSRR